jgi:hypothetical protein
MWQIVAVVNPVACTTYMMSNKHQRIGDLSSLWNGQNELGAERKTKQIEETKYTPHAEISQCDDPDATTRW